MNRRVAFTSTLVAIGMMVPLLVPAQGIGDRIRRRVEESVGRKVDQTVDCVMGDTKCIETAKAEGKTVKEVPAKGDSTQGGSATATADALKPGEGAWANYDFKPGERIVFADDFTKDEIGDFPRSMEFVMGSMETVLWQGSRWLRLTTHSQFIIPLPETLPTRYTMEFDFAIPSDNALWIYPTGTDDTDYIIFGDGGAGGYYPRGREQTVSQRQDALTGKMYRARVMADGRYLKLYVNEKRVANIPNAMAERSNKLLFVSGASEEQPTLFGNFRVAAGGRKLYDALAEAGRVATQGIYFDTGSDRIRPESTPTLKEIGAMLAEHPELKLGIEGHTDNVGNAASNQALSERRAAAVVRYLTESGIAADRLASKGYGATKPAASNDTPEGRQNNRRVELVKM